MVGFYYSIEPRERDGISKGAWPLVWKSQFVSLPTWAYFKGVLTSVVTVYRAMYRTMNREGWREREREGRKERKRQAFVECMHCATRWTSGRADRNRKTESERETLRDKSLLMRLVSWRIFLYFSRFCIKLSFLFLRCNFIYIV